MMGNLRRKHLVCSHGQDRGGAAGVQDGELTCCCDGDFMCHLDWAKGHPGGWPRHPDTVPGRL